MSRTLWLNPAVGVAGDMIVASLLDVGADESALRRELDTLDLFRGWKADGRSFETFARASGDATVRDALLWEQACVRVAARGR